MTITQLRKEMKVLYGGGFGFIVDEVEKLIAERDKWEKEARLQYKLFNAEMDKTAELNKEIQRLHEIMDICEVCYQGPFD